MFNLFRFEVVSLSFFSTCPSIPGSFLARRKNVSMERCNDVAKFEGFQNLTNVLTESCNALKIINQISVNRSSYIKNPRVPALVFARLPGRIRTFDPMNHQIISPVQYINYLFRKNDRKHWVWLDSDLFLLWNEVGDGFGSLPKKFF
ncbi:MAG TPA: hypothetical protein PK711_02345 [Bacteroidales bacterium]|nr:hypothetical protein [Bacteroidales bacterium]